MTSSVDFEFLEEAIEVAQILNDHERLGKLYTFVTAHWNLEGNSEQAVVTAKEALKYTIGQVPSTQTLLPTIG